MLVSPAMVIGQGATAIPDHVTLTWTSNPATSITITWRIDATINCGYVQYQQVSAGSQQQIKASSCNFTTDIQLTHLFTANLTGLSPNTKYTYRVGNGNNWSDRLSFTTADPKNSKFKFLVFGDSQSVAGGSSPYQLWRSTVHNAYAANPDAKFMVNVGDLVDVGQSGAHWNAWFAAAEGVIDRIPEMPVVGNHETTGTPARSTPVYWNAQFKLPQNGTAEFKNQAYSFDYGCAHFIVLDSQQKLNAQKKWLAADLAVSKAIWKIVFFHKGPYSQIAIRDNKSVRDAFCPIFDKYHVDVVFNGHDHAIGRTYPIKGGVYMKKPSEGTIYYTVGRSGTKSYSIARKRDWNTFFYDPQDQPNYFTVDVTNKRLTIKAVKTDGNLLDAFSIDK